VSGGWRSRSGSNWNEDWAGFDLSYSLDLRRPIPHILAVEE